MIHNESYYDGTDINRPIRPKKPISPKRDSISSDYIKYGEELEKWEKKILKYNNLYDDYKNILTKLDNEFWKEMRDNCHVTLTDCVFDYVKNKSIERNDMYSYSNLEDTVDEYIDLIILVSKNDIVS